MTSPIFIEEKASVRTLCNLYGKMFNFKVQKYWHGVNQNVHPLIRYEPMTYIQWNYFKSIMMIVKKLIPFRLQRKLNDGYSFLCFPVRHKIINKYIINYEGIDTLSIMK